MGTLGQYEFILFVPPLKQLKSEVFVSFNMEFKLKNFRKLPKINQKYWDNTYSYFSYSLKLIKNSLFLSNKVNK
jgi:hypothetical protein